MPSCSSSRAVHVVRPKYPRHGVIDLALRGLGEQRPDSTALPRTAFMVVEQGLRERIDEPAQHRALPPLLLVLRFGAPPQQQQRQVIPLERSEVVGHAVLGARPTVAR